MAGGVLLFSLLPVDRVLAVNGVTVDSGYGLDDTRLLRLNFTVGNNQLNPVNGGWSWTYYWEANLSYWYLKSNKEGVDDLYEMGITPNIRLQRDQRWGWGGRPFMEAGLGAHLLSKIHIRSRNLGSAFQFGTHVGLGIRFGSNEQWELAWRVEHLSNGDLAQPNPGINFSMVRFGYHW